MISLSASWRLNILFLVAAAVVTVGTGYLTGFAFSTLLFVFLVYLAWTQWNLYRLLSWLEDREHRTLPVRGGIWGQAFISINKLERNNRRRKRKLGRTLNAFRLSMSALPDATVVLSKSLEAEWWNATAERLLGLQRQLHRHQPIHQMIQTPEFTLFLENADYSKPLEMHSPVRPEILLAIHIVPYGKGKKLLQARDVTLIRHLEQVRQDFVSNASHELRTPLTVLSGYLETMLEDDEVRQSPWHHMINQMYGQVTRVTDIVADMLTLSRMDQESYCPAGELVDIETLLLEACEEATILSGKRNHVIECDVQPGYSFRGSQQDLQSIFSNLLSNAVRYTPDEGYIGVRWWLDENGAHLYVADTGIGIAKQHLPRLTERFYRVDTARSRQSGSTGLGLAIVKHALIRHDGELEIDSTEGVGSTFICHFPATRIVEKTRQDYSQTVINE